MIRPIDPEMNTAVEEMMAAAMTSSAALERVKLHCKLVLLVTEKLMERGMVNAMVLATAVAEYTAAIMTETEAGFIDAVATPFGPDEEDEGQSHEA